MKKIFLAASALFLATSVQAQFLGQLSDARVLDPGRSLIGGYVGVYDDNAVSVFGQYRYGFTQAVDGGFKMGFLDPGSRSDGGVALNGDARYQIMFQKQQDPVDLSLGGGLEFFFGDNSTIVSFLFNGMVSHRLATQGGRAITPYGRMQLRIQRNSNGSTVTDGEFGVNMGGEFEMAQAVSLAAELQLDSSVDFGLLFGLNYRF